MVWLLRALYRYTHAHAHKSVIYSHSRESSSFPRLSCTTHARNILSADTSGARNGIFPLYAHARTVTFYLATAISCGNIYIRTLFKAAVKFESSRLMLERISASGYCLHSFYNAQLHVSSNFNDYISRLAKFVDLKSIDIHTGN